MISKIKNKYTAKMIIELNELDHIKEFAKNILSFDGNAIISKKDMYYNAKSLMGLIAIDPSKPCTLELIADTEEEVKIIIDKLKKFSVEKE